jgi:CheY-like chemotaxis protein
MKLPKDITTHNIVEVRLWEFYLSRIRSKLRDSLSIYAIGHPLIEQHARDSSRITYRFKIADWDDTIQVMLAEQSIPFEILRYFEYDTISLSEKKKVYIVEDDLDILFALNTMLEDAGYDVLLSHCGAPMLKTDLPSTDVFILDKKMPDVDGLAICAHLKKQQATKNTPVIMISAIHGVMSEAKKAGADDFLEKPFQMQELLRLVANIALRLPASQLCKPCNY